MRADELGQAAAGAAAGGTRGAGGVAAGGDAIFGDLRAGLAAVAAAPALAGCATALGRLQSWEAFRALPCSTKEAFRSDFRAFLTGHDAVRLHCTSGSTGSPAFVVYSPEEIESITVRAAETMRLAGVRRGQTVLNLFGYGTFIAGNLYDWGATRIGALVIPFGSAAMTPPAFAAEAIRALGPEVVNGVPSYLARFLGELRERQLPHLDRIRIVQCAGEVLSQELRQRLQAVLPAGAEIFDQYGMTEFGPLAAEGPEHDGLRLLENGLLCEVLDVDGQEVDEGDGELVVTSFRNRAMAMVRYRTGDRVEVWRAGPGRDGRRIRVLHREDDLTKIRGVLCSKQEIVEAVRTAEGVGQFRILIHSDAAGVDRLAVTISPAGAGDEVGGAHGSAAGDALAVRVRAQLKNLARIGVDRVDVVGEVEVPKTVSGKPRFILDERQVTLEGRKAS